MCTEILGQTAVPNNIWWTDIYIYVIMLKLNITVGLKPRITVYYFAVSVEVVSTLTAQRSDDDDDDDDDDGGIIALIVIVCILAVAAVIMAILIVFLIKKQKKSVSFLKP